MKTLFILASFLALSAAQASGPAAPGAHTVPEVKLDLYQGKWFELRRIPNEFEDNEPRKLSACFNVTAEYAIRDDGKINVTNTCHRFDSHGAETVDPARAVARVVRDSGGSKLKVNFTGLGFLRWLGIGDGDYWIYALGTPTAGGSEYPWSLVGSPDFSYGWILARDANLSPTTIEEILDLAENLGFQRDAFRSFSR